VKSSGEKYKKRDQDDPQHPEFRHNDAKQERRDKLRLYLEVVGFMVVAAGSILTYQSLAVSRQSVVLTREQVHVGQRAYLTVADIPPRPMPAPGEPFVVPTVVRNVGQTPARNIRVSSGILLMNREPFTLDELKSSGTRTTGDLGAGQSVDLQVSYEDRKPLSVGDYKHLSLGVSGQPAIGAPKFYIVIVIDYFDMFGGSGRTVQCGSLERGKFVICPFLTELK
jgi:hypothetical protein